MRTFAVAGVGKNRAGAGESDDEYERVLELYCRMPLAELIVHPARTKDRYTGSPRKKFLWRDAGACAVPVAYNGDYFHLEI